MGALASLCDDTRGDWGASSPVGTVHTVLIAEKDNFLTHHDGAARLFLADKSHAACLKRVKAVQAFHQGGSRGWADIGYNTLVCPHGRLIEGRGVLTVGAQCPGYNRAGIGSQLMVGGSDPLVGAMLNRQRRFYNELVDLRNASMRKMGHRDGVSTECPGDEAEAWVKAGMPIIGGSGGQSAPIPAPTPENSVPNIPGTKLPILDVDGSMGPKTVLALGTVMKARGFAVAPSTTIRPDLIKAIQKDLNAKGLRDRDGRKLVEDGKGLGPNTSGRYPSSGWTRTITALERGRGETGGQLSGYLDAHDSALVRSLQRDLNYGGTKDSPLYVG